MSIRQTDVHPNARVINSKQRKVYDGAVKGMLMLVRFLRSIGKAFGIPVYSTEESTEGNTTTPQRKVILVGNPNVGKSVIFNRLTGIYVVVSNYPGTTVEITRGTTRINDYDYQVIDTPGMYSLLPITEEERVARTILLSELTHALVHVVDAKNVERMLPLTIQLIEANLPVILVLNMMDEAKASGIQIDVDQLQEELGIPVIPSVATTGEGIELLKERISHYSDSLSCERCHQQ
ncbi:MAG: FeoB small GTPase domain-containing protein [Chloroflexota bacterium]|nr:FeoB small GTPase domain-containing protein [Chloroflexota bacterium]